MALATAPARPLAAAFKCCRATPARSGLVGCPTRHSCKPCLIPHTAASSAAAVPSPDGDSSQSMSATAEEAATASSPASSSSAPESSSGSSSRGGVLGWLQAQQAKSAALRAKMASLGAAAVLAYGMFDGLTYTVAFTIAWLGYEARTGLNPTQNMADIVKICILMWAGNNVTRPFRVAGAAAVAPFMDRLMLRLQQRLRLPSKAVAFGIIVAAVAAACFSVVGFLFVTRWVAG